MLLFLQVYSDVHTKYV